MTDAITALSGRAKALADIDRCLHHVLCKAAAEAGRHERVDFTVRPDLHGRYLVRFTSTLPPVEVRLGLTPAGGEGPVDVAIREVGTDVSFPVAMISGNGEGRERALERMSGADHWLALHMRHRIAESVDGHTLETPGLDRVEAALKGFRTTPAVKALAALAAIAGAFVLGGMSAE